MTRIRFDANDPMPMCRPSISTVVVPSGDVAVIDVATHKVVANWPIAPGEEATGLAIDVKNHRLFIGASNQLGAAESGFLAHITSPTFAVVSGGVACLCVVALVANRLPALRSYQVA